MNAKKAKKLRRLTEAACTNDKGEVLPVTSYTENEHNREYQTVTKASGDGKGTFTERHPIAPGTIQLTTNSVRGLYQKLKKVM